MRERDQQIKQIAHKQIDDQSLAQDLMELAAVRIINLLIKLLSASYSFFAQRIESRVNYFNCQHFHLSVAIKAGSETKNFAYIFGAERGLCADGNFPSLAREFVFVWLSEKESVCVHFYLWSEEKVSCVLACLRACGYNFCYRQL